MNDRHYPDGHIFYRRMGHPHPEIVRGEGVYLYAADGRRWLDGSGGPVLVNIGHGVEAVADAIAAQARQVAYLHPTMFTAPVIEAYAAALAEVVPLADAKFYFLTSGSEANESAIKFARHLQVERGETGRTKVIGRWHSYHGTTLGTLAISGRPSLRILYTEQFRDMPHIDPPYCYRCPLKLEYPTCGIACAQELAEEIVRQGPETVAAFIAEPVSGASLAAVVPPPEYWPMIRQICDEFGVLLIDDEVMAGFGRSGHWVAMTELWDVEPDIITFAKGTAGGNWPLSIMAVKGVDAETIFRARGDFAHGGTFSHHVLGAAAGLATLGVLQEQDLIAASREKGAILKAKLVAAFGEHPNVGDIRGTGLMLGMEFVADRATKDPFPAARKFAYTLADEAFERGLIVYPSSGNVDGARGDMIMIAPPFVISEGEMDELVGVLGEALGVMVG
ncbi:MAG: aminotransferase class III-fold pyridoxal phosphate-dependent enzyme [Caldilineaceae bacterium]|nr:aminotransferase class III-fold pyridoxal phosphate-dependent enzyme [Caldilineaceae bacterium]MBP8107190.1 aminotransferase class III-fold pyridoxal phosphate-dependent enzyme [Caldilineaceae bacterium]MBP8122225.1 aminotransferase class III-fold pyridoxal phosphate-dependent enzyme [Caldilineaceae bacterium]MBP9072796.1 aminotransferase class III-fold pyridoxal phosphate-dependent enzyme [Caldilineaceae bacterium]